MGEGWNIAGRDREFALVTDALASGGATLVGPAGVGKSKLAAAIADLWREQGWHTVSMRATSGSSELPLGAFLRQLGPTERFLTPLFAELRQRIEEEAAGRRVLLVIDDIDQLDDSSAVLVHQLVSTGSATLLSTMRFGRLPPAEFTDLWQRGDVQRVEIAPLGEAETAAVAARLLGSPLDAESVRLLFGVTQGNALFVRELLLAAEEQGRLVTLADSVVQLDGLPATATRLVEIVSARIAHLDPDDRRAMLHIAFAEPCGWAEVASVADLERLSRLEDLELLSTTTDQRRLLIHLAHPLYGEVLRAATPHLQKRQILATLARDLAATGARRRSDKLRLARLAVDGGITLESDLLVAAASTSFHAGDLVLAERIGRAAFDASATFEGGWDLANSLYQTGQVDATRAHLARWASRATNDAERRAAAMLEAQLEFWYVGDLAASERITHQALATLVGTEPGQPGAAPAELLANLSLFVTISEDYTRGVELARPLLDDGPGPVLIRASLAMANALGALGDYDGAVAQLDRAVETFGVIGDEAVSLSKRIVVSARAVANAWRGKFDDADRDAASARNEASNEFLAAAAHCVSAVTPILRGKPSEAIAPAERALAWWGQAQPGSTERRWALARVAWSHAEAGSLDRAEHILGLFDADDSPGTMFDFEAALARATVLWSSGSPEPALDVVRTAMRIARTRGHITGEAWLAYSLVHHDRAAEVAERLVELSALATGELVAAFASHAVAQAADDAEGVLSAADRLAAIGCMRFAADAATFAAEAARRGGDQRFARRCVTSATQWRDQCDAVSGARTTGAFVDDAPIPLTRREREIGMLAAQGLPSREIGERLFISARTAENHLAKIYEKLGVRSRAELARVLDGGIGSALD